MFWCHSLFEFPSLFKQSPFDKWPLIPLPLELLSQPVDRGLSDGLLPRDGLLDLPDLEECDLLGLQDLPFEDLPGLDLPGLDLPGLDLPGLDLPGLDLPLEDFPGLDLPFEDLPGLFSPFEDLPGLDLPLEDLPGLLESFDPFEPLLPGPDFLLP